MSARLGRILPLLLLVTAGGCELAGNILQFGFWTGVIAMVFVLGIIALVVRSFRGRRT